MVIATQEPFEFSKKETDDRVFQLLFNEDELNWQQIIQELIKSEQMDPWDIDVSVIAGKFIELLAEMQKMDFRISGKVILAAAFFLKIKSDKLIKEDILALDQLLEDPEPFDDFLEMLNEMPVDQALLQNNENPILKTRTPQPRKRKVSVDDLVKALEKALACEQRRTIKKLKQKPSKISIPKKTMDISVVITEMYDKIKKTLQKVTKVEFKQLLISEERHDKVFTFIPLLYLDNQRKIDIEQKIHLGDIHINLANLTKEYEENPVSN